MVAVTMSQVNQHGVVPFGPCLSVFAEDHALWGVRPFCLELGRRHFQVWAAPQTHGTERLPLGHWLLCWPFFIIIRVADSFKCVGI